MRYLGRDEKYIYLKCHHCKRICSYDREQLKKIKTTQQQHPNRAEQKNSTWVKKEKITGKCVNCNTGFHIIWWYPPALSKFLYWKPLFIMTMLFCLAIFIIRFPLFQKFYLFNKSITMLASLFTSFLIPFLCSVITLFSNASFIKRKNTDNLRKRYVLLAGIAVEFVLLVFIINSIIQEQYHSLQIENPDTGEIQQYYGNAIGDIASGKGRVFDSQGNLIYLGGFKDGVYDGYGIKWGFVETIHNTEVAESYQCLYRGGFKNGLKDGEGNEYLYDAEYTFEKESTLSPYLHYTGQFVEDNYCGIGTLYNTFDKYEGSFFNNQFNGYGKYWFLDNDTVYKMTGIYHDGTLNGEGKKYSPDGSLLFDGIYENDYAIRGIYYFNSELHRYEGQLNEGNYEGKGTLYWPNGEVQYEGEWSEDKKNGYGISYREDGSKEYSGYWENDQYSRMGTFYYEDGVICLKGHWSDGALDGKGTWYWQNGEKFYEGEFKNGKQDGLGTEYNDEGQRVYDGAYADGKRNGFGISYWPETGKKEYEGEWIDDSFTGEGTSYDKNGNLQ